MAKLLRLDVAQLTDVGRKREHNEDNMAYVIPKDPLVMAHKGALFIVADGMGGHAAGEVASEIAVDTVSNAYYQDDNDDVPTSLTQAIRRANSAIHQRAAENMLRSGMGTTCVAAVLRGNVAYIANIGDSRAYFIRQARIRQISQDHSWVAEQVRAGLLTEEQARTHAQRNVITRSLGTQPDVEIDLFREVLEDSDTLILCSDGLSGLINDEDMLNAVDQYMPQESVYHLVERANENGGPDNITAIVARVQELGEEPPGLRQPVPAGNHEVSNEDTARLFAPLGSGANIASHNGEMSTPSGPFSYSSGPLASADSDTAPQTALHSQRRRGRLFYPTLVLLLLFLLALVGGGAYYFVHTNDSQTVAQILDSSNELINQAKGASISNPGQALQNLASAQQQLRNLQQNHTLDTNSSTRLVALQSQLVSETKIAITNYNQLAKISLLPCANITPNNLNTGTTGTLIQDVTSLQNNDAVLYYALGQDGKIYDLVSTSNLGNSTTAAKNGQFTSIVSDGKRIFGLSQQITNGIPDNFAITLLTSGAHDTLQIATNQTIPTTSDGKTPAFITTWPAANGTSDVYVVLFSKAAPNNVTILSYSVDGKNKFSSVKQTPISVSAGVIDTASFGNQLFLLLADGSIWSSQIKPDLTLSTPPTQALINMPIALPLAAGAQNFTITMPVPTASPSGQKGSGSLTIPMPSNTNPATISAGKVGDSGSVHLFIGDPANHRVLDLTVQPAGSSFGPGSTPTATVTGTTESNLTFTLSQQYVSPTYFKVIKSAETDPKGASLNILSQNAANNQSLMVVNPSAQQVCAS